MTITTTNNRNEFVGDGSTTVFTYTFAAISTADVDVYLDEVIQTTGFTKTLNANGVGGAVTFSTAPGNNVDVLILRDVAMTQASDLPAESNFPEVTVENALDKLTIIAQQLLEQLGKALQIPLTALNTVTTTLSTITALYVLRVNATATGFELVTPTEALAAFTPGAGDVAGPGSSTANTIPLWTDTTGTSLSAGIAAGSAAQVLTSNGAGVAPTFQTIPPVTPSVIPSGTIWMFINEASIPATGWQILDGTVASVTINGRSVSLTDPRGLYLLAGADTDPSDGDGYTGASIRPQGVGGVLAHQHTNGGAIATTTSTDAAAVTGTVQTTPQFVPGGAPFTTVAANALYNLTINNHSHTATSSSTISGSTRFDSGQVSPSNAEKSGNAYRPKGIAYVLAVKIDE
jgi:hypothetical protein